ncbi:dimethylglycine dehydrogenase [Rhodobacterales bacterium 52_120_T64]|nr:dimethylglycine dehydrogenase [Rhodobacterales bacterium 52_120_T64]
MAELPSTARVVIIGGGAVGTSALYHLAKAGWTDCVLLEKNELTSGSTWHAAGNVPTFSTGWATMNMQRYSAELYSGLAETVDYPMNYHVTGSIRLAHSKERMQEFERARGMGRYQGIDIDMCDVSDLKRLYPFLETHDLAGGLYDPYDGDIDPSQLTQAFAKGARDLGAKIVRFCPVESVNRENDEWVLTTPKGEIRAEIVVNAAGYRAQELSRMFIPFGGREVPMMTMSHQYLLTDEIPELKEWSAANDQKLPLLRDVDSSYYLRQEKNGLNLGPYERNCKGHWMTADDKMPDDFSFQLYPDDLDRLEWYVEDAMARVPMLGKVGINKVINGPIPYTPDGSGLIGPMPGVPNAFEACVFTFGIAQSGGAGKVLAEWVTEGETEWDMWSVDPRRFTGHCDQDYSNKKGMEVYGYEYAMHFPRHEWPAARNKKLSPLHDKIAELGAQFGAYNGWERSNWFAQKGDDTSHESTQTWDRDGPWQQRIREECHAVRDGVGVLDLPGFSRFYLQGEGAAEYLRGRITGTLPKINRMNLAYFADTRGRVVTEMSILRHGDDDFTLITAAAAQWHDFEVLKANLPTRVQLHDATDEYSTLIVSGPKSRDLLGGLCDGDMSLPWLSIQYAKFGDHQTALIRVSYAGELGWEIHAKPDAMPEIYAGLLDGGAKPFGMFALDSLRLEKGYRAWKGDLSTDYSVLESGLGRFLKLDKPQDFPGKAALQNEKQRGVKKRFVTLIIEAGKSDAPYMSTLWHDGKVVGETTSGGWGHRIDKSIALGMLRADLTEPFTEIEVEIYGERCKATVQPDQPLWDPKNERLRS